MIRRPPRSTLSSSSAASDVYKRQQKANAVRSIILARENATRCNYDSTGRHPQSTQPTTTLTIPRYDAQVPTALKSHLTREFNKSHKKDSSSRVVGAAASNSMRMATATQEDEEGETQDDDAAVVAAAAKAAATAKKPPAKSAGKGKKTPAAPGAPDGTKKPAAKRTRVSGVKRPNDGPLDDEPVL
eukprot:TRINITY_DN23085_c0_g1_i2.p1 TRINITY_DN23085_c0_g1~~TRINITY_DN23085_c0_g1_i2.p1  ORF type:complete len:186 (+),score=40.59 TRINITY_DN23085_c0_g1_i2:52-609(+)